MKFSIVGQDSGMTVVRFEDGTEELCSDARLDELRKGAGKKAVASASDRQAVEAEKTLRVKAETDLKAANATIEALRKDLTTAKENLTTVTADRDSLSSLLETAEAERDEWKSKAEGASPATPGTQPPAAPATPQE